MIDIRSPNNVNRIDSRKKEKPMQKRIGFFYFIRDSFGTGRLKYGSGSFTTTSGGFAARVQEPVLPGAYQIFGGTMSRPTNRGGTRSPSGRG